MLIGVYFYLRLSVDMWPPPGTQLPAWGAATAGLFFMIVSCFAAYYASEGAKQDNHRQMLMGLIGNVVLALAWLSLRAFEWHNFNFGWSTDVHGSIVWTLLFLHTFDAVADLVFTAVLIIILAGGQYGPKQRLGVHVDSIVWYAIAAIWLPLYVVIYWGPRIVGAP
jgi:cytochrome c oxidase subunit I+III